MWNGHVIFKALATIHGVPKSWTQLSDWTHARTRTCARAHTHTHTHTHIEHLFPASLRKQCKCRRRIKCFNMGMVSNLPWPSVTPSIKRKRWYFLLHRAVMKIKWDNVWGNSLSNIKHWNSGCSIRAAFIVEMKPNLTEHILGLRGSSHTAGTRGLFGSFKWGLSSLFATFLGFAKSQLIYWDWMCFVYFGFLFYGDTGFCFILTNCKKISMLNTYSRRTGFHVCGSISNHDDLLEMKFFL